MTETSKRLIIVEGPDGGGKTSIANSLKGFYKAHHVHLGPFKSVKRCLSDLYVDAMMPAVLGHSDVVMDRSWLSEVPYGLAFRAGSNRIKEGRRILERLALRCRVVVILALPPLEVVLSNYRRRRADEMLEDEGQLRAVYEWYDKEWVSDLPTVRYDYTEGPGAFEELRRHIDGRLSEQLPHPTCFATAGDITAPFLVVGEGFSHHQDGDRLYQWPFGSLSGAGCSRWLARELDQAEISERSLCWVNADAGPDVLGTLVKGRKAIFALGAEAYKALESIQASHEKIDHPQFHRRFHGRDPYRFVERLQELGA